MARIRSIHPGLFSDPEFASLSEAAQIFYLGLLTEADDNGIFEWNPAKLRIRLRPGKDGGVEPLLSELQAADKVRSSEIGGRQYGAIRNFRRFQRPKSPKSWHPISDDFRNYVGLTAPTSEIDRDEGEPFPQDYGKDATSSASISEIPPQREEGGGRSRRKDVTTTESGVGNTRARARPPTQIPEHIESEWRKNAMPLLPEHWSPSAAALADARKHRPDLDEDELGKQTLKFRLHAAEHRRRSADWQGTWLRWIIDARKPNGTGAPPGESYEERRLRKIKEMLAEDTAQ